MQVLPLPIRVLLSLPRFYAFSSMHSVYSLDTLAEQILFSLHGGTAPNEWAANMPSSTSCLPPR